MLSFPLGLPPTVTISTGQHVLHKMCYFEHRRIRLTLEDSYSAPPCSCGGDGWTTVAYLNMSDPNQQCPSNWTLTTSPVRGCGRSSAGQNICDSMFYLVHGCLYYSSVCGRVLAYQIRVGAGFVAALETGRNTTKYFYISGLTLVHGPAGSRQHTVTFAAALGEQDRTYNGLSYSSVTGKLGHVELSPAFSSVGVADLEANFSSVVEPKILYIEPIPNTILCVLNYMDDLGSIVYYF